MKNYTATVSIWNGFNRKNEVTATVNYQSDSNRGTHSNWCDCMSALIIAGLYNPASQGFAIEKCELVK